MQNKTAIKIGFLMILFSILNSIILSFTLIIVLLCLAYLIINTKIVEKLGLINKLLKGKRKTKRNNINI